MFLFIPVLLVPKHKMQGKMKDPYAASPRLWSWSGNRAGLYLDVYFMTLCKDINFKHLYKTKKFFSILCMDQESDSGTTLICVDTDAGY